MNDERTTVNVLATVEREVRRRDIIATEKQVAELDNKIAELQKRRDRLIGYLAVERERAKP